MKLFHFLVIENFMVFGLPFCDQYDRDRHSILPTSCVEGSRVREIAPPKASEVNGIERNEIEHHQWMESLRRPIKGKHPLFAAYGGIGGSGIPSCDNCPRGKKWTNYRSIDSNDGTGDHERFK